MFNKLILIAIAAGLWANVMATIVRPAHADADSNISHIDDRVFVLQWADARTQKFAECGEAALFSRLQ